jgi:hypothetical protein
VQAQSYRVGDKTCIQNYTIYDHYTNGKYNFTTIEPSGLTCFSDGSGLGGGDFDPSGNGELIDAPDGGSFAGLWVSEGTYVNKVTKTVTTDQINCSATPAEVSYYISLYYNADPA